MTKWRSKKIGVLMGGLSDESEISLKSGNAVFKALKKKGYRVERIEIGMDAVGEIMSKGIDIAFVALHGRLGEDGTIQGLLEFLRIPYTGSSPLSSALGMDKEFSRMAFQRAGLNTPATIIFDTYKDWDNIDLKGAGLRFPIVIKPTCSGSSIGVRIAKENDELEYAIKDAERYSRRVLIEEYIAGMEVSVAVLDDHVIGSAEIVTTDEFASFRAKYTPGMEQFFIPPRLPDDVIEACHKAGLNAHGALYCEGFTRADLILKDGIDPYVLEINTIPGMTENSWYPKIAEANGIPYGDLVERILDGAALKVNI